MNLNSRKRANTLPGIGAGGVGSSAFAAHHSNAAGASKKLLRADRERERGERGAGGIPPRAPGQVGAVNGAKNTKRLPRINHFPTPPTGTSPGE